MPSCRRCRQARQPGTPTLSHASHRRPRAATRILMDSFISACANIACALRGRPPTAAAGLQAEVLNVVVEDLLEDHPVSERKLKEVLGHTPRQVWRGWRAGTVLLGGVCCGWQAGAVLLGSGCCGWKAGTVLLGSGCCGWQAGTVLLGDGAECGWQARTVLLGGGAGADSSGGGCGGIGKWACWLCVPPSLAACPICWACWLASRPR